MVSDIVKTVKSQLYDRASSPLFVAFIISWSLWNYRFLLTLASSLQIQEKFAFIELNIFPNATSRALQGGIYPLITTLLIIFVYPYPAKFVYEFWRKRQKDLLLIQQKIVDETPLTIEESRLIRKEALSLELEHQKEIERLDNQIKHLRELLENSSANPDDSFDEEVDKNLDNEIEIIGPNEEQMKILTNIANNNDEAMQENDIIQNSGTNRTRTKFNLGVLEKSDLLKKNYSTREESYFYVLTQQGRTFLVDKDLI